MTRSIGIDEFSNKLNVTFMRPQLQFLQSTSICTKSALVLPRRQGKTFGLCGVALYEALCNSNARVIVCTPYDRYSMFNNVKDIINRSAIFKNDITRSIKAPYQELGFKNGSRIRILKASSHMGVRGQDADLICIDCTDMCRVDFFTSSILPMMHTVPSTRLAMTGESITNHSTISNGLYKDFYLKHDVNTIGVR